MSISYPKDMRQRAKQDKKHLVTIAAYGFEMQGPYDRDDARAVMLAGIMLFSCDKHPEWGVVREAIMAAWDASQKRLEAAKQEGAPGDART